MAWTLSGEAIHKVWAKVLMDNGKLISGWHELSELTRGAWNFLAANIVTDVQQLTTKAEANKVNEDKISWILGMLNPTEEAKLYKTLYNMGHRINR